MFGEKTEGDHNSETYQFAAPKPIAVDAQGNIIVGDGSRSKVLFYDSEGNFIREFGEEGSGPGKFADIGPLCVDDQDNIYVSDAENGLQVFTNDGKFLRSIGKGELASTESVAYDNKNKRLVVADEKNYRVQVFAMEDLGF